MSTTFPLPPDIFGLVLNHLKLNQDTLSLATILRVNKSICRATLPVLYANPYHVRKYNTSSYSSSAQKDLLALTRLLLSQSPYDQMTDLLKVAFFPESTVEESLPNPPAINKDKEQLNNYRYHLRKLNLQPESSPLTGIFKNGSIKGNDTLTKFLEQRKYRDKLNNQIWKDLTWALCYSNNLQELYLPLTDLDRYQDVVDQFSILSSVVFVNDLPLEAASISDAEKSRYFEGMVKFVEKHATLFPDKLQQVRCTKAPDNRNDCPEEMHLKLATALPPLPAPTFLDYTNWTQFVMRSKEVNLEFVKVIQAVGYPAYKEVQFEDRLFTNDGSFLQRCRSLEAVDIDIENLEAQDMFRWAVKEQQEREMDNANRKTPKPLAPLQEVSLRVGSHCQIVNDIASVFGGTLSNLYICGGRSPHHPGSRALVIDASGWKLEQLENLALQSPVGPLLLHPDLLLTCPSLKTLVLADDDAEQYMRGQPNFRYLKPAVLEHVTTIELMGTPAVAFHPGTLHTTKNLQHLQLIPWDTSMLGRQGSLRNDDDDDDEEEEEEADDDDDDEQLEWERHQAQDKKRISKWPRIAKPVWTWDWDLPKLTRLSLSFRYAHELQFKMFKGTPNLTHLRLTGACNVRALGPLIKHFLDYVDLSMFAFLKGGMSDDEFNERMESALAILPNRPSPLPKLVDLAIEGNWDINTDMLRFICSQFAPNLESLFLHGPSGFSAKELIEITSRTLRRLRQVDTHLAISSREAREAGVKREDRYSADFVLANPPQGYNPVFIFTSAY
ncbi:hypothetical protein K457DRAFT_135133 [Linnemannia elongata AG-77]|uniref:Uncharacterized protein n=1 Tax=Linnemannia elongata AG-77 TaxID=1314771 RepID=A0A197K4K5_9FUNG|nr:hypothetical protein K457DRAFT_135133 [Linnemannia elongata AG-77]